MNFTEIVLLLLVASVLYSIYWVLHHKPQVAAAIDRTNAETARLEAEASAILIKAKSDAALAISQAETMYHNVVKDQQGAPVPPAATMGAIVSAHDAVTS